MIGTLTRHNEEGVSDSCLSINSCSFRGVVDVPRNSFSRGTHARDENQECELDFARLDGKLKFALLIYMGEFL